MQKYGIISYGASLPYRRLAVEDTTNVWLNTSPDVITEGLGVTERGVLGFDQDSTTFAVDAVRAAIERNGDAAKVDALFFGTCTSPYDSKPSATIISEACDYDYSTYVADIQFGNKSGTAALIAAVGMVASGLAGKAMVTAADTINRHTSPGDMTEPYAGAGGGAIALGTENVIASIDGFETYNTDLADNFRIEGERYIKSGMLLGQQKNDIGLYDHTVHAGQALLNRLEAKPEDFKYVVAPQSTPSVSFKVAKKLGFNEEQVKPSIFAKTVGDTGSAAVFIGLQKVLEQAEPGDKIFVISYGFGSGADALALTVTENITKIQGKGKTVDELTAHKTMLDYGTANKLEYKFIRHSFPTNAYL